MGVCDCIRYKKCAKTLIHLRSSSKSVTRSIRNVKSSKVARNQIEIRSKTLRP